MSTYEEENTGYCAKYEERNCYYGGRGGINTMFCVCVCEERTTKTSLYFRLSWTRKKSIIADGHEQGRDRARRPGIGVVACETLGYGWKRDPELRRAGKVGRYATVLMGPLERNGCVRENSRVRVPVQTKALFITWTCLIRVWKKWAHHRP